MQLNPTLPPVDICSFDPRWQQPIAAQQVLDGHTKPSEAGPARTKRMQSSGNHRFLNCVIKARKQVRLRRASWCGFVILFGLWIRGAEWPAPLHRSNRWR